MDSNITLTFFAFHHGCGFPQRLNKHGRLGRFIVSGFTGKQQSKATAVMLITRIKWLERIDHQLVPVTIAID